MRSELVGVELASILPSSFQRHVDRMFGAPRDDKDNWQHRSLHCKNKIATLVLRTVQRYTSEYSANRAKRAHQTSIGIMNEPTQPTLKRSAEISLTTGRSLSPGSMADIFGPKKSQPLGYKFVKGTLEGFFLIVCTQHHIACPLGPNIRKLRS